MLRMQHSVPLVAVAVFAVFVASAATPPEGGTAPDDGTLTVKEFGRNNVIGHLGHPLGTIVRVTGTCVDGDTTRRRVDLGKTLLQIETVNGLALDRPFLVEFRRAARGVAKPAVGDDFDFYVHEWGTFDGVVSAPPGLAIERPMIAHDGFYYRPEVTVHKSTAAVAPK